MVENKLLTLIKNKLSEAEMRQGCTDQIPYAEIFIVEFLAKIREDGWVSPEELKEVYKHGADLIDKAVKAERERIMKVIENINSIGYPYGADFKQAILKAMGEEK